MHAVVFAGFSPQALASRIKDAGAEMVITMDAFYRGGNKVPLKQLVQAAVDSPDGASIKNVLMTTRVGDGDHPFGELYSWLLLGGPWPFSNLLVSWLPWPRACARLFLFPAALLD